uniref:CAP-Gly domain-containing protein n=1 Tax=Chenopodium quinoa TaxID=63459 RepID=A0A803MGF8_CHEQI
MLNASYSSLLHVYVENKAVVGFMGGGDEGSMGSRLQIEGDESVLCRVTHSNLKSFNADIRFSLQMTVEAMKEKLWKKCGTTVDSMSLELYDDAGAKIADLTDNARSFGFYFPMDGKFKEKLELKSPSGASTKLPENYMEDLCANIKVGDRCQVQPGDKRGIVKYVGQAENLGPGFWVGVQYDEPLGKHDGLVKGTRYFDCPPLHGAMVRPDKVQVGDFPERDPFEEEEI